MVPIRNLFFGETIDVAGLVTGGDLIDQLRGVPADCLPDPRRYAASRTGPLSDDVTPNQVEKALGMPLKAIPATDGWELVQALLL